MCQTHVNNFQYPVALTCNQQHLRLVIFPLERATSALITFQIIATTNFVVMVGTSVQWQQSVLSSQFSKKTVYNAKNRAMKSSETNRSSILIRATEIMTGWVTSIRRKHYT